jgi:Holliday junction resolvasome RuvABC endonuclease subunit
VSTPRVLGVDLSLTATGLAHPDGSALTFKPTYQGFQRLAEIRNAVLDAVMISHASFVAIEGYSMGSKGSSFLSLAELGGIVRFAFWAGGLRWLDVPPSTLKRYATGKGNADKATVLQAAWKRLGYEGTDHNAADALWLQAIGMAYLGSPVVELPATHLKALVGLEAREVKR